MKQCSNGFQDSMTLKGVQERFDNPSRKEKLEYIVESLGDKLDLSRLKIDQSVELLDELDLVSFEKKSGKTDYILIGGAVLFVTCRQKPLTPRWEQLVAEKCRELSLDESRPYTPEKSFSSGGNSYWHKALHDKVAYLKDQDVAFEQVSALDYMYYICNKLELDSALASFCIRRMALIENSPELQSKNRVGLAATLVFLCVNNYSDRSLDKEELAEELALSPRMITRYSDILDEKLD